MADIDETLQAYNTYAREYAAYFKGIGSRVTDIERALNLAGKTDGTADVLEIGCGDGRDAEEIVKRVKTYKGIDYSTGLIQLAKEEMPNTDFEVHDMRTYDYSTESYDVVFAFASLLHLSKQDIALVMQAVAKSLKVGGVLYISLKNSSEYEEISKADKYANRQFYLYNPEIIAHLSDGYLQVIDTTQSTIGSTQWFEMALQK